uniref:Uncharacterized protein n=1 Tax=viral metagenome TaxID=1070528 RepID=A0A6M3LEF8_9ZZZZ
MTPRQGVKIVALLDLCDVEIRKNGAYARITIPMPGSGEKRTTRRLCRRGPHGKIIMHSFDGKKIYVQFGAAELKTRLEEIFYGTATRKFGN